MVGWDGIEPPTPGFSDPPASPGSDAWSIAIRYDSRASGHRPDSLLPDRGGWSQMIRSE